MGMIVGCSASSPLPWIEILITMVGREIFDVEDVAHGVLVTRDVDLVCVVVVTCKHLEWSICAWSKFGLAFLGKLVLAKV